MVPIIPSLVTSCSKQSRSRKFTNAIKTYSSSEVTKLTQEEPCCSPGKLCIYSCFVGTNTPGDRHSCPVHCTRRIHPDRQEGMHCIAQLRYKPSNRPSLSMQHHWDCSVKGHCLFLRYQQALCEERNVCERNTMCQG